MSQDKARSLYNWYVALVSEKEAPIVTLPNARHGTQVAADGTISGVTGGAGVWNGPPPPWCTAIIEVKSDRAWAQVTEQQITVLWQRTGAKGAVK